MEVKTPVKAVMFDGTFYGFYYMLTVLGWDPTGYNTFKHSHYVMQYTDDEKAQLIDLLTGKVVTFNYSGEWLVQADDCCYMCGHRHLLDNFVTDEDMELNWYPRPSDEDDEEDLI